MVENNTEKDAAFGIIPILDKGDRYLFLLLQHQAGHWGFPKGHADPGESALQAGCREFVEETGISEYTLIEDVSFSEQYTFTKKGKTFEKTVIYFLALVQSETVKFQEEEIKNYTWAEYEEAIALITYEPSQRILTEAYQYLVSYHLNLK